jgi:hypothetical protein
MHCRQVYGVRFHHDKDTGLDLVHEINVPGNNLDGTLPEALGQLTDLRKLDLSTNAIRGNVPNALGNLSELRECYLGANLLEGAKIDRPTHCVCAF